jgi:hypothetical protein
MRHGDHDTRTSEREKKSRAVGTMKQKRIAIFRRNTSGEFRCEIRVRHVVVNQFFSTVELHVSLLTNGTIDRARGVDSTQVKAVDRGLRVQWFVTLFSFDWRAKRAINSLALSNEFVSKLLDFD